MPSQSEERSVPLWLWPNLLSLDAPIIAVLWQGFLAYRFAIPLGPAGRLVLGLTVWAIYLLDRVLDSRMPPSSREPARHRFYRRNRKGMTALLAIVVAADALIALHWLRPAVLHDGLLPLAGVLLYLAAVHLSGKSIQGTKEIAAALLFTGGTFVAAWSSLPCPQLVLAAIAFFVLCLANIIAIETWESRDLHPSLHPIIRGLSRTYFVWVPATAVVCVLAGRNQWYASIAVSAGACALLFWFGRRLSLEARRVLIDGVLLSPILFLISR
jgi:hypothetical protein